jgi:hypothetical protein
MSASAAAFFESSRRGRGRPAGLILDVGAGRHPRRGAGRRLARERGERGPWPGQSVASTAPGRHRRAGRGAGKSRAPRRGAGAGGSPASAAVSGLRTTPCRSTPCRYWPPPWRVEALAVLAGGSPASAESAGHGLGNPWPRPHREGTAGPGTAPAKAERLDMVRGRRLARERDGRRAASNKVKKRVLFLKKTNTGKLGAFCRQPRPRIVR